MSETSYPLLIQQEIRHQVCDVMVNTNYCSTTNPEPEWKVLVKDGYLHSIATGSSAIAVIESRETGELCSYRLPDANFSSEFEIYITGIETRTFQRSQENTQ